MMIQNDSIFFPDLALWIHMIISKSAGPFCSEFGMDKVP